jgi:carbamoyl-phosphate synthase large subunit
MENKRVFVSGGAGVIGTALVNRLLEEGADVFVGDLKPCPKPWLGKLKYRQGDLNAILNVDLADFEPEIFFHLAATFERSEETYSFFEENFHHNIKLSHYLMSCLKNVQSLKRVVFASSYLIYDPSLYLFQQNPKKMTLLTEESSIHPRNICGAAKFFHESELRFLDHFLGKRMTCISARIFRAYGRGSSDIISRWIRAALRSEPLSIYRPEGVFDYIFADDVAEGLLKLAAIEYRGIVNLGSGQGRSIAEVVQILRQHFPELQTIYNDSEITFEASQASTDRLFLLTNWKPSHTLEMAIPKLIDFEKAEQNNCHQIVEQPAVLMTSISKKMPLIEAVRQAANKLGKFQTIHGCDSDASCLGQYGVDQFWHSPPLNEMTPDQIISYCQQNRITAIIPTRDADLEFYAHHSSLFNQWGIQLMVSSLETILTCSDKKKFADTLLKERFPVIPTFLSPDDLEAPSYVVKERWGAGSQLLGLNLTHEEALQHSCHLKEPIFQPYIQGQEWSVDVYCSFEGHVKGCVARQRNTIVNGESQVTTTVHYPKLEHLCQAMAEKLNIRGPAVFQVIENENGNFHVIECNPRFGGASTASIAVGWDAFFWFFVECLGLSIHDYPFLRHKGEIRQIRYLTDRLLAWSSYLI